MNSTSIAMICVALLATPAGYAVDRFYHERGSNHGLVSSIAAEPYDSDPFPAGSPALFKQMRIGDINHAGRG